MAEMNESYLLCTSMFFGDVDRSCAELVTCWVQFVRAQHLTVAVKSSEWKALV